MSREQQITCGARHSMTGVFCELDARHAGDHFGEDSHARVLWPVEPTSPATPQPETPDPWVNALRTALDAVEQTIQQQAEQIETLTQELDAEHRLRLQEVEHWVTRFNEVERWRVSTRQRADAAEAQIATLAQALARARANLAALGWSRTGGTRLRDNIDAALAGASRPTEGKQGRLGNYYGRRLTASVDDGQVVVSIGVQTLAHAVAYADWANPFDEAADDYIRTFAIADAGQFAKDVVNAMLAEREDGSTPLSDFLDKMSQAAIEDGSLGLHEDEHRIKHGETAPCETWAEGEQGAPQ